MLSIYLKNENYSTKNIRSILVLIHPNNIEMHKQLCYRNAL